MALPRAAPWRLGVKGVDGAAQRGSLCRPRANPQHARGSTGKRACEASGGQMSLVGREQPAPGWQPGQPAHPEVTSPREASSGLTVQMSSLPALGTRDAQHPWVLSPRFRAAFPAPALGEAAQGSGRLLSMGTTWRQRTADSHRVCLVLWTHRRPRNAPVPTQIHCRSQDARVPAEGGERALPVFVCSDPTPSLPGQQ